jgi:hypothetical protein
MEIIDNVTMLSIILTGAALIREREHGTLEHPLGMPVTPTQIMLGKIWSIGLVLLAAPTPHFVSAGQAILYRGAGIDMVWPQLLAILAIGCVLFAGSLARFRKTISQMCSPDSIGSGALQRSRPACRSCSPMAPMRCCPARSAASLVCTELEPSTSACACRRAVPISTRTGPFGAATSIAPLPSKASSSSADGWPWISGRPSKAKAQATSWPAGGS